MSSSTAETSPPETSPSQPSGGLAKPVFFVTLAVVVIALVLALAAPVPFNNALSAINTAVTATVGWYYVLVVTGFVVFSLVLAMSRLGTIKLGKDDDEPEFSLFSWFAMLFAAGMGIGLVFWGAAEPLTFFQDTADDGAGIPPNAADLADPVRADHAMGQTFLHWGLHAWAIYVVVGLAIAYAVHRKGRPISIRWALEPVLGKRTNTWIGDLIDIVALVGTLFGIATSLGFGVNQIVAGLDHLGVISASTPLRVIIIVLVTGLATLSAATGVDKGIKILSNLNLGLAAILLVAVLIMGPTLFLLRDVVSNVGYYLQNFLGLSFQTLPFLGDDGNTWLSSWTTYYWGWWISWSPFVGVFIARVSKGRTVREFITGVLLVPSFVTLLWFTVMGGSALYQAVFQGRDFRDANGDIIPDTALFDMLTQLPLAPVLSGIAIILVSIFFVTSADSGAFVMSMIAHRGDTEPPKLTRVVMASASGVIAAALIWAGAATGDDTAGMSALQALALLSALPFSIVMIAMCVSLWKSLSREVKAIQRLELRMRQREFMERYSDHLTEQVTDRVSEHVEEQVATQFDEQFTSQLDEQVEQRFDEALGNQFVEQWDSQWEKAQEGLEEQVAQQVQEEVAQQLSTITGEMAALQADQLGEDAPADEADAASDSDRSTAGSDDEGEGPRSGGNTHRA